MFGGITKARRASQAPNIVKTSGKAAASEIAPMKDRSRKPPKIMRKAPRFSGAQGTRIEITDNYVFGFRL